MLNVSSPYYLLGHSWGVVYSEIAGLIYRSEKVENEFYITEITKGAYGAVDMKLDVNSKYQIGDKLIYEMKRFQKLDSTEDVFNVVLIAGQCHFCRDYIAETKNGKRSFCYTCNKVHQRWTSKNRSWAYRRRSGLVPAIPDKKCLQCNKTFIPARSSAKFCSSKCRLQCHRAKKSPAPSSVKVLEVLFDPNREDRYKGRSVEWFKAWGSQMCLSTADRTDKDIKELVKFATIFKKDENWKKYYPDLSWEDFCLEVFKKPAAWIDHWLNNFKK